MKFVVIVLAAVSLPLQAVAQASSPPEGFGWAEKPTGQDLARLFPRKALNANVSGWGVAICRVNPDNGRLRDCKVGAEAPDGFGFGKATLAATKKFRLSMPPGDRAGGVVMIPLMYGLPGRALPARTFAPGELALLAEPPAEAAYPTDVVACPSAELPDRLCPGLAWKKGPTIHAIEPVIRQVAGPGTVIECTATPNGKLEDCEGDGSLPAALEAELLGHVRTYEVQATAFSGATTANKRVQLRYYWPTLRQLLDIHSAVSAN